MNSFKQKTLNKQGLGQKLSLAREKRGISLKDASKICKIPEKYLESLEQEKWNNLPGDVYAKMFLKKYCSFLRVHCGISLEEYKKRALQESLKKNNSKIKQNKLRLFFEGLTTHQIRRVLFVFVIFILLLYIYYETSRYMRAPNLEIFYPPKNYITSDNSIDIKGKTDPEATVYINGDNMEIEESGEFTKNVKLKKGINQFEIKSQRKHGRQQKENVVVFKKEN